MKTKIKPLIISEGKATYDVAYSGATALFTFVTAGIIAAMVVLGYTALCLMSVATRIIQYAVRVAKPVFKACFGGLITLCREFSFAAFVTELKVPLGIAALTLLGMAFGIQFIPGFSIVALLKVTPVIKDFLAGVPAEELQLGFLATDGAILVMAIVGVVFLTLAGLGFGQKKSK